jgi:hypothetical protein
MSLKRKRHDPSVCWVLYNTDSLSPIGTSGIKFTDIPPGHAQAKIDPADHAGFISGEKRLSRYFVEVLDKRQKKAKFVDSISGPKLKISGDDVVRDLNLVDGFFDYVGITFKLNKNVLVLIYDASKIDKERTAFFKRKTEAMGNTVTFHVTKFNDQNTLLESVVVDTSELINNKTVEVELKDKIKRVSVWGTRLNYQR